VNTSTRYVATSLLLLRDDAGWRGVCIELGVNVRAETASDALDRLIHAVGTTVTGDLSVGSNPLRRRPSDQYWELYHDVLRVGSAAAGAADVPQLAVPALFVVEGSGADARWHHIRGSMFGAAVPRLRSHPGINAAPPAEPSAQAIGGREQAGANAALVDDGGESIR
jgi:hypothetical protein